MATNEILTTASVDNGTNLQTQSEYSADAQRPTGQSSGVARSKFINKTLRQLSLIAAAVAQFIADRQATNVTDGLAPTALGDMFEQALVNRQIATATGTADAILLALAPTATTFSQGLLCFKATAANASASPTVKRDGLTAKPLVKGSNLPLTVADIPAAGAWMWIQYDPVLDKEVLLNPATGVVTAAAPVGSSIMMNNSRLPTGYLFEDGAAVSRVAYPALFAYLVRSAVTTISIASPGVVTWNGHGLSAYDPVKWTSTGVLPTGVTPGTTYFVVAGASLTVNTFQFSATPGGAAIVTSGSQSGTHTAINAPHGDGNGSTTFNVPLSGGEFIRAWDNGRGVDANRGVGSAQLDQMQGHVHGSGLSIVSNDDGGGGSALNAQVVNTSGPVSDGTNGTPRVGPETRPRNVAKLFCIKY